MTATHVAPPLTRREAREIERRTGQRPIAVDQNADIASTMSLQVPSPVSRKADAAALAADVRSRIEVATSTAREQVRHATTAETTTITNLDDVSSTGELAKGSLVASSSTFDGPETVRSASIKAARPVALVRKQRRLRGVGIAFAASAAAVATVAAVSPGMGLDSGAAQASLVSPDTALDDQDAVASTGADTSGSVTDGATQTGSLVAAPETAVDRTQYSVTTVSAGDVAEAVAPAPAPAPAPVLAVEFVKPYPAGAMNEGWGTRGGAHNGIDMVGGGCGADLVAVASGTVTFAGPQGGYGNHVEVDLGGGTTVSYSHLQPGGIGVSVGQQLGAGDYIGAVGTTGNSTGCHLHFEVKVNGSFVNPVSWLGERGISV